MEINSNSVNVYFMVFNLFEVNSVIYLNFHWHRIILFNFNNVFQSCNHATYLWKWNISTRLFVLFAQIIFVGLRISSCAWYCGSSGVLSNNLWSLWTIDDHMLLQSAWVARHVKNIFGSRNIKFINRSRPHEILRHIRKKWHWSQYFRRNAIRLM